MPKPVSEYELIQAISGADEHGYGKCVISIQPQRCDADGNVVNTDDEYVTEKPVVKLFRQPGGYVMMDLIFGSIYDADLRNIYAILEDYSTANNSSTDDDEDFPLMAFSIVPQSLRGEYFAIGFNPIFYSLTPADCDGEPKIIRLLFASQDDPDIIPNFLFLKSDEEEYENIVSDDESLYD